MDKLEKLKTLAEDIVKKNRDYESDPEFEVHSYAGGNIDDAFSMGVEQGAYDVAFAFLAVLGGTDGD